MGFSILDNCIAGKSITPSVFSNIIGDTGSYIITEQDLLGTAKISDNTFRDCAGLTSVAIPRSITSIGDYAFSGCTNLQSISIPSSIESTGLYAFEGCENLTLSEYDNAYYLGNTSDPYLVLIRAKSTDVV